MKLRQGFTIIKNFVIITLPTLLVLFLILEVFFRFGIEACTPPNNFFDEDKKLYCFDDVGEAGNYTIGKFAQIQSQWHINNMRWNAPIDYNTQANKPLIAVIGDSYIEAFQVDIDKSYPFLLDSLFGPSHQVYAFGKSGNPLSQYLHISRYVAANFNPDILIFNVVHNDFAESIQQLYPRKSYMMQLAITDEGIQETVPKAPLNSPQYNPLKALIRKSALFRYFVFNVKFKLKSLKQSGKKQHFEANIDTEQLARRMEVIKTSTEYIIQKIKEENPNRRIIFTLDAPRNAIYTANSPTSQTLMLHSMMDSLTRQQHVEFIDLKPLMEEDYQVHQNKFNSDLDHHWNEYGHQFVAKTVYNYLSQ